MDAKAFDSTLQRARTQTERLAWFGALLTKETGLEGRLVIVGGSAIEIYLGSDQYVSEDIDVVGEKARIKTVLERWGFSEVSGRDRRRYLVKAGVGQVDLVGPQEKSGLPARKEETTHRPVLLAPVEYLIARRLVMAAQEKSPERFSQAVALAVEFGDGLDWDYIEGNARYERVLPLYQQLCDRVKALTT